MTPYQTLWDSKSDLQYLKIIDSAVYAYNTENQTDPDRKKKFDPKIKKTRFINYGKGINQYRIWNPNINRIEKITFVSIDEKDTTVKKRYTPIYLDYENSNNPDYQSDESIPNITFNGSQPEMIIPEFTSNKDKYLLFEFITNQVSHAPNPAIDETEPTIYEKTINKPESIA
jgi:hypothetical protein